MSILMIGNSFLAAFKQGLPPGVSGVSFLGGSSYAFFDLLAPGFHERELSLSDSASRAQRNFWRRSFGSDNPVKLDEFGLVIAVGAVRPPNPWPMSHCVTPGHEALLDSFTTPPISFSLYRQLSIERYALHRATKLRDLLLGAGFTGQLLFIPSPHIRDDAHTFASRYAVSPRWQALTPEQKDLFIANENALYLRLFCQMRLAVCLPPHCLVSDGNRCPADYSRGALGSGNYEAGNAPQWGNSPVDAVANFSHKNAEYGRAWWDHLLRSVPDVAASCILSS